MKLALILLSALVVITHQQFQQHPSGRPWWSPYSYPQLPSIVTNRREIYYNNNLQDDIPSFRRFRPARPVPFFPQSAELDPSFAADDYYRDDDFNAEEEFPDSHSRKKVLKIRYRPFSNNQAQQQQRFFMNYYSSFNSILTKTVTLTLTSTVNQTSVQSCIAAANFLDPTAQVTPCRRKRDILENVPEDITQFVIAPSETQRVRPTALPSLDRIRENRQLPVDDTISGSMSPVENLRDKRFFKYSVTSVTVTTYNFLSTTVTKAVNIAGPALVSCLPSGWVVC